MPWRRRSGVVLCRAPAEWPGGSARARAFHAPTPKRLHGLRNERVNGVGDQSGHNPALAGLDFLSGQWDMELSNAPFLPSRDDTAHGHVTVEFIEDGALLVMRQREQSGNPPSARWAIGRDESDPDYKVLYSDNRGVSRVYEMSFAEG